MQLQLAAESHVPCFQERVGTSQPEYMIPVRLPWRLRARPSATLHEIQVRPERRTCSAYTTQTRAGRQEKVNLGNRCLSKAHYLNLNLPTRTATSRLMIFGLSDVQCPVSPALRSESRKFRHVPSFFLPLSFCNPCRSVADGRIADPRTYIGADADANRALGQIRHFSGSCRI